MAAIRGNVAGGGNHDNGRGLHAKDRAERQLIRKRQPVHLRLLL
jgi:hypothetical protein